VVALLGNTGKRIRTAEDAEIVRRVFVELGGAGSFADPAEGPHTRVNESLWHIAGSRSLDGKLAILEIYLGPDEVVESGRLISE
jgi:hypothetical protein